MADNKLKLSIKALGLCGFFGFMETVSPGSITPETIGIGTVALSGLKPLLQTAGMDYLISKWKDSKNEKEIELNHNLEKAFIAAINSSINDNLNKLLGTKEWNPTWKEKFQQYALNDVAFDSNIVMKGRLESYFYNPLKEALTEDEFIADLLKENNQLKPNEFISEVIKKLRKNETITLPKELSDEEKELIINDLKTEFEYTFILNLTKELKKDENAKTAYFTHILHSIVTDTKFIKDTLEKQDKRMIYVANIAAQLNIKFEEIEELKDYQKANTEKLDTISKDIRALSKPSLKTYKIRRTDEHIRYAYDSLFTHFVGRENEMSKLHDFLDNDDAFSWHMVSGPAGSGKSRLANELCQQRNKVGWYTGFLKEIDFSKHESWNPNYNVLIVLDYSQARQENVKRLLEEYQYKYESGNSSEQKTRILLLDRSFPKQWKDSIANNPSLYPSCSAYNSMEGDVSISPIELPAFSDNDRWSIMCQLFREIKTKKPERYNELIYNKEELLKQLEKIDSQKRPLFAFFVANALTDGENISNWNINKVLENHLERLEEHRWSKYSLWKNNKHDLLRIMFIATLGEEISYKDLSIAFEEQEQFKLDLRNRKTKEEVFEFINYMFGTHEDNPNTILKGLKPDILGEFFLLKTIKDCLDEEAENYQEDIRIVWRIKPENVWWMSWLAFTNFNKDEVLAPALLKLLYGYNYNQDESNAIYYSFLFYNLSNDYGQRYEFEVSIILVEQLRKLSKNYQENEKVTFQYAMGLFNIIHQYGLCQTSDKKENLVEAQKFYNQLKILSIDNKHNEQIALVFAQGTYNLARHYGEDLSIEKTYNLKKAQILIDELRKLSEDYKHNEQIVFAFTLGAANLIAFNGTDNIEKSKALLNELKTLVKACKDNEQLAIYFSMGIYNLALNYEEDNTGNKKDNLEKAQILIDQLKTLSNDYKNNEQIALNFASGALFLSYEYGEDNLEKVEKLNDQLKTLSEDYQGNEQIALQYALGMVFLAFKYEDDNIVKVQNLNYQLKKLSEDYKDNTQIVLQYANGVNNLSLKYARIKQFGKAQTLINQLRVLSEKYSYDKDIVSMFGNTLAFNSIGCIEHGDLEQADIYFKEFNRLIQVNLENELLEKVVDSVNSLLDKYSE